MNLGAYKEAAKIKSDFGLPNDMLLDAVTQSIRCQYEERRLFSCRRSGQASTTFPADLRLEAAERSFNRKIDSEFYRAAADYAKEFGLPEDMVREAAIQAFHKSMSFGLVKNAAEIAEEFELPAEMIQEAAMKSYEQHMQAGLYRKALKIAQKYNLPEEMVAAAEKKIS
ncbi:MAG: hypothetical protein MZV70_74515 [Desulfobacterales bacterium]|nr:hypothetical protein [Desulfobacterales bacterium]